MGAVFLDTGYLIALEAGDDQHHGRAVTHWRDYLQPSLQLVTTTYVFSEIVTYFNVKGRHEKAVEIGRRLVSSPRVRLVEVDRSLFEAGWRLLQHRPDKRYSLTDCISFVVMEREGLREALCFDAHCEQAGFAKLP